MKRQPFISSVVLIGLISLFFGLSFADIPPGYYDSVDTSSAAALRLSLHLIIDDHVKFPYTADTTDTWDILELADEDPLDSAYILDVYKNASYIKFGTGNDYYNREHSWPKSFGFPDDTVDNYPYTDCHQLFLSDSGYNSARGNRVFASCLSGCTEYPTLFYNGVGGGGGDESNWGTGTGNTGSWETWIDRRGDVARALLYMDVRYEGGTHGVTGYSEPDLILTDNRDLMVTPGFNDTVGYMGLLSVLLQWNEDDPVDAKEQARNDVVYSFQGNRNPFIDHPEWVTMLFGSPPDNYPVIANMLISPVVPTTSETLTVSADVTDDGSLTAVDLYYAVDGTPQTPISMTLSRAAYSAEIPAQANGALVEFYISATDDAAQTTESPVEGVYWGSSTIDLVQAGLDTNGELTNVGYYIRLQGVITAEPGIFSSTNTEVYIEDATGGINLYKSGQTGIAGDRGDLVEVVGAISQYNGLAEIDMASDGASFTNLGPSTPATPSLITLADVGEAYEGMLVTVENLTLVSGSIPASGSGNLEVSDASSRASGTIRIDGDTDIPGANDPSGTFAVTGILSQYDTSSPYDTGYQILPRERTDFDPPLTGGTPPPASLIINEFLADPPPDITGDANGDGVREGSQDEFIELINVSSDYIHLDGWRIEDGYGIRHQFEYGYLVPPGEAVVVFGGGTPTGSFGNCTELGLVFTASDGLLGLNNSGDTISLYDPAGNLVDTYTYGSEADHDQSLNLDPDITGATFAQHSTIAGSGGAAYSVGTRVDGSLFVDAPTLLLTEVFYDHSSGDDGFEWVELYNNSAESIDLSSYSLGNGGTDYTYSKVQLTGTIAPYSTFVVGGPTADSENGNPVFDQVVNFDPDFQNSGTAGDGVALFDVPASSVTGATVPIDAVIYGPNNSNGLMDSSGTAPVNAHVGDADAGETIERISLDPVWRISATPAPNQFGEGFPYDKGDTNFDGVTGAVDLVALINLLNGNITGNLFLDYVADLDGNGVVEASDLLMAANMLAGNL